MGWPGWVWSLGTAGTSWPGWVWSLGTADTALDAAHPMVSRNIRKILMIFAEVCFTVIQKKHQHNTSCWWPVGMYKVLQVVQKTKKLHWYHLGCGMSRHPFIMSWSNRPLLAIKDLPARHLMLTILDALLCCPGLAHISLWLVDGSQWRSNLRHQQVFKNTMTFNYPSLMQELEITKCFDTLFWGHFSKSIITAKSLLFEDWLIEVSEGACISAALPLKLRQR